MKTLYIKKGSLLFLLLLPLSLLAQQQNGQRILDSLRKDYLKKDSARKAVLVLQVNKRGLLKRDSVQKRYRVLSDSAKRDSMTRRRSGAGLLQLITVNQGRHGQADQQLFATGGKMGQDKFISLRVRGNLGLPVKVGADGQLSLIMDDKSVLSLPVSAAAVSQGNGLHYSSDLSVSYMLSPSNAVQLTGKKVTSVRLVYQGGAFTFPLTDDSAAKLKSVIVSIK